MIREGEKVLLLDDSGNLFLGIAGKGFAGTGKGTVDLRHAVGKNYGEKIKTTQGGEVKILKFMPGDIRGVIRGPQIVTPKDAGAIVGYTGIGHDSIIVEGGTGSAALTIFLANVVKKVFTYEVRDDFFEFAGKNIEMSGLTNIEQKKKSLYEGIDETNVDAVVLDVPEPWQVSQHALNALVPGGWFVAYVPTVNQVEQFVQSLKGFSRVNCLELIERHYSLKPGAMRPETKGLMHTGFLCFARKL